MSLLLKIAGHLPGPMVRAVSAARWRHPWLMAPLRWVEGRLRHRDGTIQQGLGKGLRFNPGSSNAGYLLGTSEPEVQRLLEFFLKPGMVVYDGGANVGFVSVLAARLVGPSGRVVAFEPLPANADQIAYNARLNGFAQVEVRREAIGRDDAEAEFRVSADSVRGMLETGFAKADDEVVGRIAVQVRGLDRVVAEADLPPPDLVKLDVEGAEADALLGGEQTLRRARPVLMIELHDTNRAVAEALGALDYRAAVVGSVRSIVEAPWNAYVVAVPRERAELVHAIEELCPTLAEAR